MKIQRTWGDRGEKGERDYRKKGFPICVTAEKRDDNWSSKYNENNAPPSKNKNLGLHRSEGRQRNGSRRREPGRTPE